VLGKAECAVLLVHCALCAASSVSGTPTEPDQVLFAPGQQLSFLAGRVIVLRFPSHLSDAPSETMTCTCSLSLAVSRPPTRPAGARFLVFQKFVIFAIDHVAVNLLILSCSRVLLVHAFEIKVLRDLIPFLSSFCRKGCLCRVVDLIFE
jgi:hypothetical protein